ncbi:holo-ACP synthase [Daejeonella sp.]|uniref:holo-ACP synthase n=1 Tax=Daejeonella sp. TaxID=2805397 RepID=UPI0030C1EB41
MNNELLGSISTYKPEQGFAAGNDLVFMPHFRKSFNELFKKKIYTVDEIAYCESFSEPLLRFASTWAAKEAIYKAVKQVRTGTLSFKKIEIKREKPAGKPQVILPAQMQELQISLTISHDGDYVWALAIVKHPVP